MSPFLALHRAQAVPITLPPQVEYVVDLRFDEPISVPAKACDLAIHPRDTSVQGNQLSVAVHNIGTAAADNFVVALQRAGRDGWQTIATQKVVHLAEPTELVPFVQRVSFTVPRLDLNDRYRFVLDPEDALHELCETNNLAEVQPHRLAPLTVPPDNVDPAIAGLPPTLTIDLGSNLKIELVLIPPGEFMMGPPAGDSQARPGEMPQHRVRIDRPFYLSRYEITQAEFKEVTKGPAFQGDDKLPAGNISSEMADKFCDLLSKRIWGPVRLPSEAEWEYACRANAAGIMGQGVPALQPGEHAWTSANSGGKPHPVGTLKANAWGLYDMQGNVQEWVADPYDLYPASSASDEEFRPRQRVLRGGHFGSAQAVDLAPWRRCRAAPARQAPHYGLRLAVDPPAR